MVFEDVDAEASLKCCALLEWRSLVGAELSTLSLTVLISKGILQGGIFAADLKPYLSMFSLRPFLLLLLSASSSHLLASHSLHEQRGAMAPNTELKKILGVKSPAFKYDKRMLAAAEIASARAARSPQYHCWRHVKVALLKANVIDTYPKTVYAKQAAHELQESFGFRKLPLKDPYEAPKGAVLVYGGAGPGHIELRSEKGFVSDFVSLTPSHLPLIGIYVKPRS